MEYNNDNIFSDKGIVGGILIVTPKSSIGPLHPTKNEYK
jgi:hypothetical protein